MEIYNNYAAHGTYIWLNNMDSNEDYILRINMHPSRIPGPTRRGSSDASRGSGPVEDQVD